MDIFSPFVRSSCARRPPTSYTLRAEAAGRKGVLTVFSAPPHSRLIREISFEIRAARRRARHPLGVMGCVLIGLCASEHDFSEPTVEHDEAAALRRCHDVLRGDSRVLSRR
jgi:hypothetical protein